MNQTPSLLVNEENNDELLQMVEEQKKNGMIEFIVVNNKAYFFFMCSSNQIQDIMKFCCPERDASVLGIDTAFNLCDLWVTENTRIVSRITGNHLVFLGPLIFHFTKDKSTFSGFGLEMMKVYSNINHLKKVGTEMDESIYNGAVAVIPEVKQLYCVRHLGQHDEKTLDGLFGKTKCSVSERNHAQNEILKDTYGDQEGSYEEFGLAESQDKPDFNAELASLKEKWESRCPVSYNWCLKQRNGKFENSVIASA